jgi:hypothetical protein
MGRPNAVRAAACAIATLLCAIAYAGEADDTVFLTDGGRVRGTVIEESPGIGVRVRLADGRIRQLAAKDVKSVQYAGEAAAPPAPVPPPSAPVKIETPAVAPSTAAPPAPPPTVTSAPPALPPAAPDRAAAPRDQAPRTSRALAFIPLGLGVIGLGVGAVTGAMTLSQTADIKAACPNSVCSTRGNQQAAWDSANTLATVSDVGFVVGGIGAAVGLTWLLWPRSGGPPPATASVGPGSVRVTGSF